MQAQSAGTESGRGCCTVKHTERGLQRMLKHQGCTAQHRLLADFLFQPCTRQLGYVQAEWHHKKFSRLQHLQSPARLIRELVKPRKVAVDTP